MLAFRDIGTQVFQDYVKHQILQQSCSTKPTLRRHKLLTMKPPKLSKRKSNPKEQEAKQVIKCLRRRLAWCKHSKLPYKSCDEQYSILPRALADEDGNPHKSSKSSWSDKLAKRYECANPSVFMSSLLHIPQVVIIDAMFMLNTRPLRQTKTIIEYTILLFNQFVIQYYKTGVKEVHLIFDKPGRQNFNPKQFEHNKRYILCVNWLKNISIIHLPKTQVYLMDGKIT